ncbi:MAG TPA: SpoIIE family protein phosphatase [Candidatus Acidoferrales bacterium]|nr:SpoIIE family protein phosphatase [Candidatus Acidoferrales bacterium]
MANSTHLLASVNLVLGGLVFLLGLVILRENPRQRLNRIVSMLLFFGGFGTVLAAVSLLLPVSAKGASLYENAAYLWELFFPTTFVLASIFPEERAFLRAFRLPDALRWSGFLVLVFAPHVFHFILLPLVGAWAAPAGPIVSTPHALRAVVGIFAVFGRLFLNFHRALFSLVDLCFGSAAIALLVSAWRSSTVPRIRQQLSAIAVGLAGSLVLYASSTLVPTLFGVRLDRMLQAGLTTGALLVGSGAIAYAMVRHKFLDAKLLARRGILYAIATALLIGLYLLVVERLQRFVSQALGIDANVIEPVFLVLALTLFQPAIGRLEESLDQLFLRDPGDYRNVLRQLGRELQTTIDLDDLLSRSIHTLRDALLLRSAYIVAITPQGPVAREGSGPPLTPQALAGLADILPRLSTQEPSFRLSDPVDGLRRLDRELLVRQLGVSLMVPLRWRGESLGLVLLGEKLTGTEYTGEDVALLNQLGGQMGVSLQNALLLRDRLAVARLEEELHLAQQIQQTFLRNEFPPLPRCEVHAVNLPSRQVGGDYYDVVPCGDGSFYVAIADVAGKGVPAALMSSMLQAALRTQAREPLHPNTILLNVNALVYRSTAVHQFATFFLAHVHADGRRLTYCNAGHNWPVLVRANGESLRLERGGLLLGIMEDIVLEQSTIGLESGDVLVMYTDGISEAANRAGELFGEDRVGELVREMPADLDARAIGERLLGEVERHLGSEEAQDDRTLVVLRVRDAAPAAEHAPPREHHFAGR